MNRYTFTLYLLLLSSLLFANSENQLVLYETANALYTSHEFESAEILYDSIINLGYSSPDLFYNLGNTAFKNGKIGKSILNYERALKLNPGDEDIIHNLNLARNSVVTKIEEQPELGFIKTIKKSIVTKSTSSWSWYSIVLIWLSVACIALFLFINSIAIKKVTFFAAIGLLLLSFLSLGFGSYCNTVLNKDNLAIIMNRNIYVKSAPDQNSIDLFILHEGVKTKILDRVGDWTKIIIADGNVGWVPAASIEII